MSDNNVSQELLSLRDVLLLYLYREGAYRGTKAELARKLGYSDGSWVGRNLDDLVSDDLIQPLPNDLGYELTPKGKRRMRLFGVPRVLIALAAAISMVLVAVGVEDEFFGVSILPSGLIFVGLVTFCISLYFLYLQLQTEHQVMKRKAD